MSALLKDPMFFYGVAFVIFMALAYRHGRKPALGWLDGEIAKIRGELDQARKLRLEAETILAEYRQKQAVAMADADAIVNHAKQEAANLKVQAEADLAASLKRYEQQALERIRIAESEAIADVRAAAVDRAVAIAHETLAKNLDDAAAARLVDQAIADIKPNTKAKAA